MFQWLWAFVGRAVGSFESLCAELAAREGTPPWMVWILTLPWWEATLFGMGIFAIILGTKRVLRWPTLLAILLCLLLELVIYFAVRYLVFLLERFAFFAKSKRVLREIKRDMRTAETYQEWASLAQRADIALGNEKWKYQPESRYYNSELLLSLTEQLRTARLEGNIELLSGTLQQCLHKNTAGIQNENLYSKTLVGTKIAIDDYIKEVIEALQFLKQQGIHSAAQQAPYSAAQPADENTHQGRHPTQGHAQRPRSPARRTTSNASNGRRHGSDGQRSDHTHHSQSNNGLHTHIDYVAGHVLTGSEVQSSPQSLLRFLQACKRTFGTTALCLSGGASLGNYHWGVIRALLEENLLPRVVSGTSSGAVVAAVVGTRTDAELRAILHPHILVNYLTSFDEGWFTLIKRVWRERIMYSQAHWIEKLQWFAGSEFEPHMTFLEAHRRTGRILSITCTSMRKHNPAMLLNYITTPNVCIYSAILASAAVPGFIKPVVLMEKINGKIRPFHDRDLQWVDGSLQRDLPLAELSEQFGANFFLVSQTNPHIIPFFFNARGASGTPSSWRRRTGGYRGGFLLSALELFLKEDMKKNLRVLSELDLLPSLLGSDFSFLFLQDFQGQITLVPNAGLRDYYKIISNPTLGDMERYIQEGKITTWRKFSMIRNRVLVGNKINECIRELVQNTRRITGEEPSVSPSPVAIESLSGIPSSAIRMDGAQRRQEEDERQREEQPRGRTSSRTSGSGRRARSRTGTAAGRASDRAVAAATDAAADAPSHQIARRTPVPTTRNRRQLQQDDAQVLGGAV